MSVFAQNFFICIEENNIVTSEMNITINNSYNGRTVGCYLQSSESISLVGIDTLNFNSGKHNVSSFYYLIYLFSYYG